MFDTPIPPTEIHRFFLEHYEGAQNAALLLGGRPWLRRVQRLIGDLMLPGPVTRRSRVEIEKFYRLLTLQYISDFESAEAAYFAEIDPAGPEIAEVCLLSEALERAAAASGLTLADPYGEVADPGFERSECYR